jgi:pimeloyl-CoA synthetase
MQSMNIKTAINTMENYSDHEPPELSIELIANLYLVDSLTDIPQYHGGYVSAEIFRRAQFIAIKKVINNCKGRQIMCDHCMEIASTIEHFKYKT